MIRMRITPWIGAAAIAGLVLANSVAVEARQDQEKVPKPSDPSPGLTSAGSGTSATAGHADTAAQKATHPTTAGAETGGRTGTTTQPAGQTGAATQEAADAAGADVLPAGYHLEPEQLADIKEELEDIKADSVGVSPVALRQRLMAKAEALAAGILQVPPKQLAAYSGVRRQLRALVRSLVSPEVVQVPAAKPVPERLDATLLTDIERELWNLKEANQEASPALLRQRLMARAETLAADSLGITTRELAKYPLIRRQLWEIVYMVVPPGTPTPLEKPKPSTGTRSTDDDDSRRRCDCVYCQPSHAAGICSLPYQSTCLPTLPTAGAPYYAAPYYAVPYAPKHHFLHGLFCPCSWCRGGW